MEFRGEIPGIWTLSTQPICTISLDLQVSTVEMTQRPQQILSESEIKTKKLLSLPYVQEWLFLRDIQVGNNGLTTVIQNTDNSSPGDFTSLDWLGNPLFKNVRKSWKIQISKVSFSIPHRHAISV
jgi:hypothetical protein